MAEKSMYGDGMRARADDARLRARSPLACAHTRAAGHARARAQHARARSHTGPVSARMLALARTFKSRTTVVTNTVTHSCVTPVADEERKRFTIRDERAV
eukprot:6177843-Pleurochrysis_carterae.AAC.1